jgi:hypothetical protein
MARMISVSGTSLSPANKNAARISMIVTGLLNYVKSNNKLELPDFTFKVFMAYCFTRVAASALLSPFLVQVNYLMLFQTYGKIPALRTVI